MLDSLAQVVEEHRRQFETSTLTADRSLLERGLGLLNARLKDTVLEPDTVHYGEYLCHYLGNREAVVPLLIRYLSQDLSIEEAAWARWNLTDNLALLHRCAEAVATQQAFLAWAEQALPPDRLLWVMFDGTQALCWIEVGKAEAWLEIFEDLMQRVQATPENRFDRHLYLRTAGMLLCRLNRPQDTLEIVDRMQALCQEDPGWERSLEVQMEGYGLQIAAYDALKEVEALRQVGVHARDLLHSCQSELPGMTVFQKQRLGVMCCNVAAPLYRARQYDLSIPLHEQAVLLGTSSLHAHLWLAAALWATTKNRSEVLGLLQKAAALSHGHGYAYLDVPEFADVSEDPEFRAAVQEPSVRSEK